MSTQIGWPAGRTDPSSRTGVPEPTRRSATRALTRGITVTAVAGEAMPPTTARTVPVRRQATRTAQAPTSSVRVRAIVTQPETPRFCTATAAPAAATPLARRAEPENRTPWP